MKAILGGICFVLGLLSAGGLFFSTVRMAWSPIEGFNSVLAYFGFGIPMLILGGATGALWEKHPQLLKCLGWSCMVLGLVSALGLLALLAGWVGLIPAIPAIPGRVGQAFEQSEAVGCLLAFGIPMLICGGAGIGILTMLTGEKPGIQDARPEPHAPSEPDPAAVASPESATSKPWWRVWNGLSIWIKW
jgi:hypothetical protein